MSIIHVIAILGLGVACIAWGLLQRLAARIDRDLDDPHVGCHAHKLRDTDR